MSTEYDWDLFTKIAERLGANTSSSDESGPDSVRLNGVHVTMDREERRAHSVYVDPKNPGAPATRSRWLDNNILVWIDVLMGRD